MRVEKLRQDRTIHEQISIAQRAWDQCGWNGSVLPAVKLAGGSAWPVVEWNFAALESRAVSGDGPVLDRTRIRTWLKSGWPVPAASAMKGFVFLRGGHDEQSAMPTLAPFGQIVWWREDPSDWDLWLSELKEIWLVDGDFTVRAPGRAIVPRLGFESLEARLLSEQFFQLAIDTDCVPAAASHPAIANHAWS